MRGGRIWVTDEGVDGERSIRMDRRSSEEFPNYMSALCARGAGDEDSLRLRSHRHLVKVVLSASHCGQSIGIDSRRLDGRISSCIVLAAPPQCYLYPVRFSAEKPGGITAALLGLMASRWTDFKWKSWPNHGGKKMAGRLFWGRTISKRCICRQGSESLARLVRESNPGIGELTGFTFSRRRNE